MTVVIARGYAWMAEADGIAHATPSRGHHTRTLCGRLAIDERFARPAAVRCGDCQTAIDRPVAPESQGELAEAWGK